MQNSINFSKHFQDRIDERSIKIEWIFETIKNPNDFEKVKDNEIHYLKTIVEYDNRCLKVIFNPITKTLISAFFDRNLKKKGCNYASTI